MINVDVYSFLAFSDLTCHLEDRGIGVPGCIVPPDNKKVKLGSSDKEASPSAGENTGVVLVPCRARKCVFSAISCGADIPEVPGCHLLRQMSPQPGLHILFQGSVSHKITAYLSDFYILKSLKVKDLNKLILGYLNINALRNTFELLTHQIKDNVDILMISETKLDES